MESILQNDYIFNFNPPSPDSDRHRGGGSLVSRPGYAAGVGRQRSWVGWGEKYKIQILQNAEHPPIGK